MPLRDVANPCWLARRPLRYSTPGHTLGLDFHSRSSTLTKADEPAKQRSDDARPGLDKPPPRAWAVDRQLKDIFPNDLKKTLEAHRKSNKDPAIKWIVKDYKVSKSDGNTEEPQAVARNTQIKSQELKDERSNGPKIVYVQTDGMTATERARAAMLATGVGSYRSVGGPRGVGDSIWPFNMSPLSACRNAREW